MQKSNRPPFNPKIVKVLKVLLFLFILLLVLSVPGHIVSTQTSSLGGNIVILLSIIGLATATGLLIALPLAVGQIGFSEGGPTLFLLILTINWLLSMVGLNYEQWSLKHTLYQGAGEVLALISLINIVLPLLIVLLFGATTIFITPVFIALNRDLSGIKSLAIPTVRLMIGILLLVGLFIAGLLISVRFA
jgi:hypothetical protein